MFRIVELELDKYMAIVYSCSYDSPLSYLLDIEKQIRELGIGDGYIILKLQKSPKSEKKLVNFIENQG